MEEVKAPFDNLSGATILRRPTSGTIDGVPNSQTPSWAEPGPEGVFLPSVVMTKVCARIITVGLTLLLASVAGAQQEKIINKADTERVFGFKKAQWEAYARALVAPDGWTVRLGPHDTGTAVMSYNATTGVGLSIQPLYDDEDSPPGMLIVGSWYPAGTFPEFTESLKQELEAAAKANLGSAYSASISFKRTSPFGVAFDVVDILVTKASN